MSSVKKNFLLNAAYQILILLIPLITSPYLSRVVGAEGVGIYSYTYSIVYYFMIITLLGVNNYGNRAIAKVRDDKKKMSETFWEIYIFQLILGIIMFFLYIIYLNIFESNYKKIALIQMIFILSSILDINWFYFGIEKFKKTITRSTFVKITSLILIFIFVKSKNDLWKYTLIMSATTAISQLVLWLSLKKYIELVKITKKGVLKHIKPNFILFIPIIAVSLYKIMDKIMLGFMTTVSEVGIYENAEKIVSIPLTIVSSLGTVLLPRISNIVSNGNINSAKEYITKSLNFIMFISFAMALGLIGIGYDFAPMFYGQEFQKAGILIMMLAVTIPFVGYSYVLKTGYCIPFEKDKIYIISVILGAIVNLIANSIFIPKLSSKGACIGTIIAEFVVMIYQIIAVRKDIKFDINIKEIILFFLKAIIMLSVIYLMRGLKLNREYVLIMQVLVGILLYMMLNIKYIKEVVGIKSILHKIKI